MTRFITRVFCTLFLLTMCIAWGANAQNAAPTGKQTKGILSEGVTTPESYDAFENRSCDPVQDLTGSRNQHAGVDLTWKNPDGYNEYILQWDRDTCHSAAGTSDGFYYATLYHKSQLTAYAGKTIRRVGFLPYMPNDDNATATIQLCIWATELAYVRPDAPLYTQTITNYTPGEWTNVELNTPFSIPPGKNIYIGFYTTYTGIQHPATFNYGAGANGFSNLISSTGAFFTSYMYNGTVVSWLIHTIISDQPANKGYDANKLITLPSHVESGALSTTTFNKRGIAINTTAISTNKSTTGLKGYSVYRDNELIKTTSVTGYRDIFVPQGDHQYTVKALYDESCTESTPVTVTVTDPCTTPQIGTLPYQEGFENGFLCWGQELIEGDPFSPTSWISRTGSPYNIFSAHSGTLNAYFSGDYLHSSALLISPRMEFLATSTPYLTFYHMNQRYQEGTDIYRDTLKVYYRAGSTQTWTLLETYDIADTWTKRTIVLPNPGANYQIAFKGIAAWGSGILLDDIAVTDGNPCAVPVSLNLEEGFNTPAFPPACWTSLNIGGSGTGYFQTIDAGIGILPACTPHSGAGMLRYRSAVQTAGAKAQLITPLLDLPNDSYTVSFWVFRDEMPAKQDRINIYFNTEKNTNGLTPLITVHRARSLAPATTVSGWHEYRVDFNCPTTNTGYVIIEAVSDYGYDIHLDDILIGNLCMPITNLDFTTNGNNVSLSWNVPEVSVGFMGYNIYRNETFITTITDVETTTFTDNNLSQGGYTYCVEAAYNNTCGAAPAVCTPNIAITNSGSCNRPRGVTFVAHQPEHYNVKLIWYPPQSTAKSMSIFEEGFNSGIPNSWKNMDKDGDGNQWKHSSQYTGGSGTPAPYAGDGCAISQSYLNGGTILTPDNWLISPAIDIVGKCELKYYVGSVGTDYAEHYGLYVSTTGTDYDNFTLIQEETLTSAAWKEHIVDLSAYSGRTVYFAFRHFNCSNQFIFKLDEVSVTMVDDASIVGYNVYRDNVKINKTVVTTSEYLDLVSAAGNYTYGVTAIWPDYCESAQTRVNVYMPGSQCAMPIYLPMMEGFNEDPFPKQCWTNEVDGARQWRRVTSGTNPTCSPHTGAGMIMFQSLDYSAGITLKLITPMLQVDDAGDYFRYKISFWMYRESRQYASSERADKVNLYLSQTPSSTDLDPILTVHRYIALSPVVAAEGWYKYEVEIDRPFDVGYVMIEGVSAWGRNIYVDDLSVDGWAIPAPACNPPTALTPTVTGRSVSLTWTAPAVGTPTGYNVFRNNELQETVTTTSYTCDYVSNGSYTYCVTALYATPCESTPVCVNNVVVNSDVPCDAPENVSVNMAAYNGSCGAQITWTAPSTGGNSFNVYRDGTKIASGITATSYTDTGFSPGEHNWCVTTTCDTDESLEVCATGTCTVPTFTITATAGENGTITPSGEITVNYGDNQTFTITANSGYRIARVLVNNINYPASASAGSHTFTNVKGNATITATFGPIPMVSTEEDPIWYFMENGATPDVNNGVERSGLLLTSTGTTSTTYTNVNVLNINSDRDAQLWRLQDEGDDFVSVINKKTGNKLTLSGSYYSNIPNAVVGDRFYIQPYTDLARVRLKRNSKVVTTHLGCYNAGTQWRTYNQSESAQMTDTWTFYTESDYFDAHIYPELSSATNEKWYFIESASTIAGMTGSVITQTDAVGSPVKWLDKIETEGSEQDKQLWKAVSVEGSTQNVNFVNKATGNYLIKVENIAQGTTTDASGAGYLIKYLAEGQFNLVSTDRSTTTQGRVGVKAVDDNVITKTASTDGPYRNTGGAWKFISATPAVVCNPPTALVSTVTESTVALAWTAPAEGTPTGYKIFRDDVLQETVTTTTFTQENVENGTYNYCVKAVYEACESEDVCASVEVDVTPQICTPPANLTTTLHSPDWYNVRLAWDIPSMQQKMRSEDAEIFDNGPIVTNPGQGANGADASAMPNGGNVVGSDFTYSKNYSIADDFTLAQTTNITTIDFYGFQTYASTSPSPFTAVYVRIYDGDPSNGGQIVWGDMTTNVLQSSVFSGVYRTYYNNLSNTDRAIFLIKAAINTTLQAGAYWVEVSAADGSTAWAVPVTTTGTGDTGNGKLNRAGTWSDFKDTNLNRNLGLPFVIYGTASNMVTGYNVYRDDVKLNTNPITDHFYLDMTPAEGEYTYGVTAVWSSGCESEPATTTVSMPVDPCADPVDLPLSENFDAADFPPFCWTITSPTDVNWQRVTGNVYPSVAPHSGAGMAMYNSWANGDGNSGLLITPRLNLVEDYYTLSFWMYRDNSMGVVSRPDRVNAYFSTNKSVDELTPLITVHRSTILTPAVSSAGWYRYSVTFDATAVQSGYVILEAVSGNGYRMDIDDVNIEAAFPCDKPQLLSYTAHAPNWYNVKLNWEVPNALSGVTVSGYNVYRNNEKLTGTPITALTYTDLTSEAGTYEYGVTTVWSNGCESEKAIVTVVMDVDPCSFAITTYPFTEGFEEGSFSLCWKQEQAYGSVSWNVVPANTGTPNTAHGGSYKAYFAHESDAGYRTKLVSPMFDLTVISNPELSFWHTQKSYSGDIDELRIYYKTSATGTWTLLREFTNDIANWTKTSIALPNASSTYWIAFEGKAFWGNGIMLDDIYVDGEPLPVCNPPTALVPTVTESTVALAWTAPAEGTPTGYKIFRDDVLQGTVTTTTFSQENVANGTYSYCVKAIYTSCESDEICISVEVDVPPTTYIITATAGENGSIDPEGEITVIEGSNQTFTFTADNGYEVDQLLVDNINIADSIAGGSYTFKNITEDHIIALTFKLISIPTYTITAIAGENGSIDPEGAITVNEGDNQTFTFTADNGYEVDQLLVDNVNIADSIAGGSYTFKNVTEDHIIAVTFKLIPIPTYTITATAGENGSIDPTGNVVVNHGDDQTFTITPNEGYKIAQVLVDGVNNTEAVASGSYTFTDVTAAHTIEATFEQRTYIITATAGKNGSIDPMGIISAAYGDNKTFVITPDEEYQITQVLIDGVNNAAAVTSGSYTFNNITGNHTIEARFKHVDVQTATINVSYGAGGKVSPNGLITVSAGENKTFTIMPNNGYKINQVLIDGVNDEEAVATGTYTFENVTEDHSLVATFTYISGEQYFITASSGTTGGVISPNGKVTVMGGDDYMFTITPNAGYKIKEVLVDGVNDIQAVQDGYYIFENITASHTIVAKYEKQSFTIMASVDGIGGTITPAGATIITYNGSKDYKIASQTGYMISEVLIDGVNDEKAVSSGKYTFKNVMENHTIVVSFKPRTYEITATAGDGGTIAPEGISTITYGSSVTYDIVADAGYKIKTVMVDGKNNSAAVNSGVYTFSNVTAKHTIAVTFTAISNAPMAIGDDNQEITLKVYPNPTVGALNIESGALKMNEVKVFDITGRLVLEVNNVDNNKASIDLSNYADGVYFIRVDGKTTKVVKR